MFEAECKFNLNYFPFSLSVLLLGVLIQSMMHVSQVANEWHFYMLDTPGTLAKKCVCSCVTFKIGNENKIEFPLKDENKTEFFLNFNFSEMPFCGFPF